MKVSQSVAPIRRLSNLQWDYLIETAEIMASDNLAEHERTLSIITILFGLYLRISELVSDERSQPVMSDFETDTAGNWWLNVTGKGNKVREIPIGKEMLNPLKR